MADHLPKRDSVPPERRAYKRPVAIVLFLAVVAAGMAADLLSKHYVFESFLGNPELAARLARLHDQFGGKVEEYSARDIMRAPQISELLHRQVMPGMRFTLSTNPGIVFGATIVPRAVVNLATVLTILLVIAFFATSDRCAYVTHIALACIVGGAMGNLYDRAFSVIKMPAGWIAPITNEVRDFIDFSDIGYVYVFNVADVLLVVGVGLLILAWLLQGRRAKEEEVRSS